MKEGGESRNGSHPSRKVEANSKGKNEENMQNSLEGDQHREENGRKRLRE